jgi:hypothetical protein
MTNNLKSEKEVELKDEDYEVQINFEQLETILTKEEKQKCYEVVSEVSKYLKTDREKIFLMERLALELENDKLSVLFGKTARTLRENLNLTQKTGLITSTTKKGIIR